MSGRCYQITGEAEFNEVFFTDVHMPDTARLGSEGDGWRVAVTTLMNERVSIGGGVGASRQRSRSPTRCGIWRERWSGRHIAACAGAAGSPRLGLDPQRGVAA